MGATTYIFILLDTLDHLRWKGRSADSEIGRERHLDLAIEKARDDAIALFRGFEQVSCNDGKGEVVLGVQSRKLSKGRFELATKAAKDDAEQF